MDNHCSVGNLPLRHESKPFHTSFVKTQSGFGVRETIGCCRLEGGVDIVVLNRGGRGEGGDAKPKCPMGEGFGHRHK